MSVFKSIAPPIAGFLALMALGLFAPALGRVLDLALPFFGLILLGFVFGKAMDIPEAGLAWMHAFIVYLALPALFFNLISVTPIAELANGRFILITSACTLIAFACGFGIGWIASGGKIELATVQGVAGGYSNVGYMGPGLTLATFGAASVAPTALIFTFDSAIFFTLTPFLMGLAGGRKASALATALSVARKVFLHPFNIAIALGVLAAWAQWRPPLALDKMVVWLSGAAAPCDVTKLIMVSDAALGGGRAAFWAWAGWYDSAGFAQNAAAMPTTPARRLRDAEDVDAKREEGRRANEDKYAEFRAGCEGGSATACPTGSPTWPSPLRTLRSTLAPLTVKVVAGFGAVLYSTGAA